MLDLVPRAESPEHRARIIAVTNQKGGVGKTTTSINVGAALADLGYRVLLVDMDPQAHTTLGLGIDSSALALTMSQVLTTERPLSDILLTTRIDRLMLAPAHVDLAFAEEELSRSMDRDLRLQRRIIEIESDFDYVLVDSPAAVNLLTINTMAAARELVIPMHCQYLSLAGLSHLLELIRLMKSWVNQGLAVAGLLVTQYQHRSGLHRATVEQLRKQMAGHVRVFETMIPYGLRVQQAAARQLPVIRLFPTSPVAVAYREMAAELVLVPRPL